MIDTIKKYADFNELEATVTFKFNQDGTYSIEPDVEQWNSTWGTFCDAARDGAREYEKSMGVGDAMVEGFESGEEFLGYSIAYYFNGSKTSDYKSSLRAAKWKV